MLSRQVESGLRHVVVQHLALEFGQLGIDPWVQLEVPLVQNQGNVAVCTSLLDQECNPESISHHSILARRTLLRPTHPSL